MVKGNLFALLGSTKKRPQSKKLLMLIMDLKLYLIEQRYYGNSMINKL